MHATESSTLLQELNFSTVFSDPTAYHEGISIEGKVAPQIAPDSGKGSKMKMKLARVVFEPQALCVFLWLHSREAYNEYMRYDV